MVEQQYGSAVTSPARWQWESSSGTFYASQSNNCGPTCVTKIAQFYRNTWFPIEATRRLVTQCCVPTTGGQQAQMLNMRGVPALPVWIDTLSQLNQLVGWNGLRPIIIGVQMSRVPYSVKDHVFDGWHAIVVLSRATKEGVNGYWVMDPNFSPPGGYRTDPDRGKKFYSESVMYYAYIMNYIRWSVVPNRPKPAPVPIIKADGDKGMKYKNEYGHKITVRAFKPLRDGATTQSRTVQTVKEPTRLNLVGRIVKERLPTSEQQFGDVFIATKYITNGSRLVYIKQVDARDYA